MLCDDFLIAWMHQAEKVRRFATLQLGRFVAQNALNALIDVRDFSLGEIGHIENVVRCRRQPLEKSRIDLMVVVVILDGLFGDLARSRDDLRLSARRVLQGSQSELPERLDAVAAHRNLEFDAAARFNAFAEMMLDRLADRAREGRA